MTRRELLKYFCALPAVTTAALSLDRKAAKAATVTIFYQGEVTKRDPLGLSWYAIKVDANHSEAVVGREARRRGEYHYHNSCPQFVRERGTQHSLTPEFLTNLWEHQANNEFFVWNESRRQS